MFQLDHSVVLHFEQSEECADCAAILCQILQNRSGTRDAGLAGFTILEGTLHLHIKVNGRALILSKSPITDSET